jgi:hypothetical protein
MVQVAGLAVDQRRDLTLFGSDDGIAFETQGHCVFGGWPFELRFSECLAYVEAVGAGEIT